MGMHSVNAVICGRNQVTASIIRIIRRIKHLNIVGYWCESITSQLHADVAGIKVINSTFDDLLSHKDIHVLFLCDTPFSQHSLVSRLYEQGKTLSTASCVPLQVTPYVVILPPISPNYDLDIMKKLSFRIGVAMPLRRLPTSTLLFPHLSQNPKQLKLLNTFDSLQLPAHWRLGNLENIHIRLSTLRFADGCEYSWLCESENMGGGLLNIFCPSLIDLVYTLTGLQMTSVTCFCRTFGGELSGRAQSLRRISADDYITVLGELDTPSVPEARRPVVVIVLSSDIPFSDDRICKRTEVYSCENHRFRLQIEIIGSGGSYMIDEDKRQISWTPRKLCLPKPKLGCDETSPTSAKHEYNNSTHDRLLKGTSCMDELTNGKELNGHSFSAFGPSAMGQMETQTTHLLRTQTINKSNVQIKKLDELTEVAQLSLSVSHGSYPCVAVGL
ncbi:unnamed protein product [Heterobilharzia americana]|nr:unnamed protein product [Heterobilharzia americana]CAH8600911.1 unnamed protein product [Heterobilharzia americana]